MSRCRKSKGRAIVRGFWSVALHVWQWWHRIRGRTVFVVMVNESRVYERPIPARTEEQALQEACRLISQRGDAAGWQEVGRYYRNVRTRRPVGFYVFINRGNT